MAAYIGSQKIDKCYLGTQEIDKVMLGAHEVCASAPPVVIDPCEGVPITSGFLKHYANPEYTAIPANQKHRLYPMGSVMPISYWGAPTVETTSFSNQIKPSDIDRLVAHGFTAYGVDFGNDQTEARKVAAGYAGKAGLRHICSAYGGSNTANFQAFCTSGAFDNGPKEQGVVDRVGREVAAYIAEPRWNDYVDMWFVCPEETGQRMDSQAASCGRTAAGRFLKNVRLKVNATDPQKRPMVNTDLESTTPDQYRFINRYREAYTVQTYKGSNYGRGQQGFSGGYPTVITQTDAKNADLAARTQTFDPNVATTEKQFASPLCGPYWNLTFIPATHENWISYTGYMVLTHMAQNAKGIQFYTWAILQEYPDRAVNSSNAAKETCRTGILTFIKTFTDYNFQNACLWGKSMKGQTGGVGVTWTGPQDANFYYNAESITYFDRQLGNCRYIGLTNSHWSDTCHVSMSGLQIGDFITDVRTGVTTEITSTTKHFNVTRENWEMFRISGVPATPQPAPAITTHPVGGTFHAGDATPVFTVGYTPPTASVQWQWQHIGSGKTWVDIGGATADTYHMTKTHIESAHDGDEFRAKVTTSGHPPVYSHTAHITVS